MKMRDIMEAMRRLEQRGTSLLTEAETRIPGMEKHPYPRGDYENFAKSFGWKVERGMEKWGDAEIPAFFAIGPNGEREKLYASETEPTAWARLARMLWAKGREEANLPTDRDFYPEEDEWGGDDERTAITGSRPSTKLSYYDSKGYGFRVMGHNHTQHSPERPLAVVIHPGDMIVHGHGGIAPEDREDFISTQTFANANLEGMRKELMALKRKGYDYVVLHRESSTQFPDSRNDNHKKVWLQLQDGSKRGSTVFGDDLPRAAKWMINNLHIAERPHVYMLGAYSDPEAGCLTAVGREFAKVLDPSKITVSKFSPVSDDPDEQHKSWVPGN